jgi:hypothetical protein
VTVLFHDDQGALVGQALTDESGETRSLLPLLDRPGLVTVVVPDADLSDGAAPTLVSVETLPWSDDQIDGPLFANDPTVSLAIILPGTVEGAASYAVDAGAVEATVTDPSQPVVLTLPTDRRGPPAAVLATALDEAGIPLAWSLALEPAADVTLEAWRDDFVEAAVEVTDNPEGTTGFGYLAYNIGGREYDLRQPIEVPGPSELVLQRIPDRGEKIHIVTGYVRSPSRRGIHVDPIYIVAEDTRILTIDLASQVLAPLERAPTVIDRGSTRPRVDWDESDQLRSSHRTRVTLRYTSETRAETWILPSQRDVDSVRFPELPAELFDRAPVDLEGAEVDLDLISGEDQELLTLYAGGRADAVPAARSRFESPTPSDVSISSTTFALSPAPAEPR